MSQYNWYCFKTVLPKKDYENVDDGVAHIAFFKPGEPVVVLKKDHRYHQWYIDMILAQLHIEINDFANQLKLCKSYGAKI